MAISSYKGKFLAFWGSSMVLLTCVAMATNIDWAKPEFEEMLNHNLGRKVILGHLSWNFSFNGFAVATSRLKIFDLDGHSPFLNAAHSEIGVAFSPLLHHQMVLQHIVVRKPEIWMVRFSRTRWNYSDLFDSIVTAKFINAYDAIVHVRDHLQQPAQLTRAIPDYDFEHVQLRFVNPRPRGAWPFFLSGKLPRRSYTSTISISTLGSGTTQGWKYSNYKFKIKADKLNPADLGPLTGCNIPLTGIIDLDAKGSGSFAKGFTGTARTSIDKLQLPGSQFVHLPDVNTFTTQFSWSGNTVQLNNNTAHVMLSMKGDSQKPDYTGKLSAKQVALNSIMSWLPIKWRTQNESPSRIDGQIEVKPDRSVSVTGLTVTSGKSKICADGTWSVPRSDYNFKLSGRNVELSELGTLKLKLGGQEHILGSRVGQPGSFKLNGRLNFTASLQGSSSESSTGLTSFDADFLNDSVDTKDFKLSGLTGNIKYQNRSLVLDNLLATIYGDSLMVKGSVKYGPRQPNCCLDLTADRINLKDLAAIFRLLKLDVPVLQKGILTGTVKMLDLKVRGRDIHVALVPDLVHYLPEHAARALELTGGKVIYENNSVEFRSVNILLKQGPLQVSGLLAALNTNPELLRCRFKTKSADVVELNGILSGPYIPAPVQREFRSALNNLNLLRGKLSLNMGWRKPDQPDDYTLSGTAGFTGIAGQLNCCNRLQFSSLSGAVSASGRQLTLQDLHGTIGASPFHLSGTIANYRSRNAGWQIDGESYLTTADALKFLPGDFNSKYKATGAFHFRTHLAGDRNNSTVIFSCHTDSSDRLSFSVPPITFYSPLHKSMRLDGSLLITCVNKDNTNRNNIELKNCYFTVDKSVVCATGNYGWNNHDAEPAVNVRIWSADPVPAETMLQILGRAPKASSGPGNSLHGSLYGSLEGSGPLSKLVGKAFFGFNDLTVPQYDFQNANGTLDAPRWIILNLGRSDKPLVFGAPGSSATLKFSQMESKRFKLQDVSAQLTAEDKNGRVLLALNNGRGTIFGGTVHFAGWLDNSDSAVHLGMDAADIDANMVMSALLDHSRELTGKAAMTAVVDTNVSSRQHMVSSLSGYGSFRISNGTVYRFSPLQERLSQFNLLHQGVFGFNLNNLLQTMVPVRNGRFNDLSGSFDIQKGIIVFKELRYDANDMRLWGVGTANLPMDSMEVEVAGRIPRVLPSVIGGPMGRFSRTITLQNLLDVVTMHKLESLPSFPVLGDIANDRPRTFEFKILSPLDKPHSISQSIEKSFAWLPSVLNASAHPVLSIPSIANTLEK